MGSGFSTGSNIQCSAEAGGSAKAPQKLSVLGSKPPGEVDDQKSANYATTKQAGGVASMIIKVGQEEYMNYDGAGQTIMYGTLGDSGKAHQLYKEDLVLLKDHNIEDAMPRPVFGDDTGMYVTKQLNIQQFAEFISEHKGKTICKVSLRFEPVLYVEQKTPTQCIVPCHLFSRKHNHKVAFVPADKIVETSEQCKDYELHVRKELVNMATVTDDFVFYYYNTTREGDDEPHRFKVQCDDDMITLSEVLSELNLTYPNVRCVRCAFPLTRIPELSVIDELVDAITTDIPDLVVVEDKDMTTPRCHFALCLTVICRGYMQSEAMFLLAAPKTHYTNRTVDTLISLLPDGAARKTEVDILLDQVSKCTGEDGVIAKLLEMKAQRSKDKSAVSVRSEEVYLTQLYVMLIIFNYYHYNIKNAQKFSDWLRCNCLLMPFFIATLSPLIPKVSECLGKSLVLVNNSNKEVDHLSGYDTTHCYNFRKMPKLPIYGVCQPSKKGLDKLNDWLIKKANHSTVTLISVREDPSVLCNEEVYCLRHVDDANKPLCINHVTADELNQLSEEIITAFSGEPDAQSVIKDETFPERPTLENPASVYSAHDNITFVQVPLPLDKAPAESAFMAIQGIVEEILNHSKQTSDGKIPAVVFCCDTGKDRTTTAMCIAGLTYGNYKGFGYGASKGEVGRISIWDAQYTKGEFKVIQQIISAIPGGHQSKREVDYILDQCFETSSMMHYHAREEIFVIFKKKLKIKASIDKQAVAGGGVCVRGPKKGKGKSTDMKTLYKELHKQSLDNLERYAVLNIYNLYLTHTLAVANQQAKEILSTNQQAKEIPSTNQVSAEAEPTKQTDEESAAAKSADTESALANQLEECLRCRLSFMDWLHEYGLQTGLLQILDNLSFCEFEEACFLRTRLSRNCYYDT